MTIKSFKRYEQKYLINREQYEVLVPILLEYMDYDENCKEGRNYEIYNLYFDTANNDIIRHSISKPFYKEKLRLRTYTIPKSPDDAVFLELKKKIGEIVNKRRVVLTLDQAYKFLHEGIRPSVTGYIEEQVLNEIEYYLKNKDIIPKVYIGHSRKAFFLKDNNDFRITFDSLITTRRNNLYLEKGNFGELLLEKNQYVMEIKNLGAIPLWLSSILSQLKIYSTHFSKYGNEFIRYCENNNNNNNNNTWGGNKCSNL